MTALAKTRNIGISAHIDSGKTTLTERMLFYAGRIHRMGEVRGSGAGATMDFMELEKERGITITSAATTVDWDDHTINLIDTPGHVDFTVEVERSLRVLDGAVLVLCAVGGVQSQSVTVDRQMRRYNVPRIAFVNKLDRTGADPGRVMEELETKLGITAAPLQIPIGLEEGHVGVVDLVSMKAVYFDGAGGEKVRIEAIPTAMRSEADRARHGLLDTLSLFDDELMEVLLDERDPDPTLIRRVIRQATLAREIVPVTMGAAFKNKGVQPLLDAACDYLPSPLDRLAYARDNDNDGAEVVLSADPDAPPVAMAFKIVDESFGQLTYVRVYQGRLSKGAMVVNTRTHKRQRIGRIVRMHADQREECEEASAGDIVAVMGIDAASGDTYAGPELNYSLERIHLAEPVISLAIRPTRNVDRDKLGKALARFMREDPTFHVRQDEETGDTLISGMGELHLEVYVERIRREYKVLAEVGAPSVSYREAPTREVEFNYKHKKQTGGAGQYAHVIGRLVPIEGSSETDYEFENKVRGGRIPTDYIPSVDKGFQMARAQGPVARYEVVGVRMILEDGSHHPVDSSDLAFQVCGRDAFREAMGRSRPAILEPIMAVEVEVPTPCQGSVTGDLSSRRGIITGSEIRGESVIISAEVPLANMFGYATDVRSQTQGRATFSMEFLTYRRAPRDVQDEVARRARETVA